MEAKERVRFNIRGNIFEVFKSSLSKFSDSKLSDLTYIEKHYDPVQKEYFFDRDPEAFNMILNACMTGELHIPKHMCGAVVRQEMEFWNIPTAIVSECCWPTYFRFDEDIECLADLKRDEERRQNEHAPHDRIKPNSKHRIWNILTNPEYSNFALGWYYFYLFVVALSALVFCLSTLPELRTTSYLSDIPEFNSSTISNSKEKYLLFYDPLPALLGIDLSCLLIFTTELILSFIVCPSRLAFLKKWLNVISIVLITSMWITIVFELEKDTIIKNEMATTLYLIIKSLSLLRLLLFLRLEKKFKAFRVLLFAIRASLKELMLMCVSFFIAVLIFSSLMFYSEIYFTESSFYNIFITMWWAIVTMTTVGYGDLYPTTAVGYVVGSLCTMFGLLILALPIAVIVSNFSSYYSCHSYRERYVQSCFKHQTCPCIIPLCATVRKVAPQSSPKNVQAR